MKLFRKLLAKSSSPIFFILVIVFCVSVVSPYSSSFFERSDCPFPASPEQLKGSACLKTSPAELTPPSHVVLSVERSIVKQKIDLFSVEESHVATNPKNGNFYDQRTIRFVSNLYWRPSIFLAQRRLLI